MFTTYGLYGFDSVIQFGCCSLFGTNCQTPDVLDNIRTFFFKTIHAHFIQMYILHQHEEKMEAKKAEKLSLKSTSYLLSFCYWFSKILLNLPNSLAYKIRLFHLLFGMKWFMWMLNVQSLLYWHWNSVPFPCFTIVIRHICTAVHRKKSVRDMQPCLAPQWPQRRW